MEFFSIFWKKNGIILRDKKKLSKINSKYR